MRPAMADGMPVDLEREMRYHFESRVSAVPLSPVIQSRRPKFFLAHKMKVNATNQHSSGLIATALLHSAPCDKVERPC